jgi:hypothetical protein
MKMFFDKVAHTTKVTYLKGVGYGVRVFTNGNLSQETIVDDRIDVGKAIRDMLRMEDKCGNISKMAHSSRHRQGKKEIARKNLPTE